MKYTANCPAPGCQHEFVIAGIAAAKSGLTCPQCGTDFVPEKVHRTAEVLEPKPAPPAPSWEEMQLQKRVKNIRRSATTLATIGGLFATAGVLVAALELAGHEATSGTFIFAGAAIGIGLWFYLVSQIVHIRANTEK